MPHQKLSASSPKSATAASDEERFMAGAAALGASRIPTTANPGKLFFAYIEISAGHQ